MLREIFSEFSYNDGMKIVIMENYSDIFSCVVGVGECENKENTEKQTPEISDLRVNVLRHFSFVENFRFKKQKISFLKDFKKGY